MFRRLCWRLYDRFFDRVEDPFTIDSARLEWIRTNEPQKLRPVFGATRRNAQRFLQLGFLAVGIAVWFLASAAWIPGYDESHRWFNAGLLMGAGWVAIGTSRLLAYLAYLRGDDGERRPSDFESALTHDASGGGAAR